VWYNSVYFAYKFTDINISKYLYTYEFGTIIHWCNNTLGFYEVDWVWGKNAIMLKDEVNPEDLIAFKLKFNFKQ